MESLIHKLLFPVAIILIVVFAMVFPQWLIQWGNFSLKQLIIPLLMLIMFGMGTSMSIQDFRRVSNTNKVQKWSKTRGFGT